MSSAVIKRSVTVHGHKTSVSLEDRFWQALHEIASSRKTTLAFLVDEIDSGRHLANLSSHIRLFVLDHYRAQRTKPASDGGADSAAEDPEPLPC